MNRSDLPFRPRRSRSTGRTAAVAALMLAIALGITDPAVAASSGGRVYDPAALRVKKEPVPKGRTMRPPRAQVLDAHPPARSYAVIPHPAPNLRGGSKYNRKGRYFYEKPSQISMGRRAWNTRSYTGVIPNPTHWSRRVQNRVR